MQDLISIIVPAYNAEKTIKQCLDSICMQDGNLEVLVINDGSIDNTETIVGKYAERDARVKLITVKNGGVAKARNIGLSLAGGKYIGFADADDIVTNNLYTKLLKAIETHDLAISGYTIQQETGNKDIIPASKVVEGDSEIVQFVYEEGHRFINSLWNKLFVKEKISIGFDETKKTGTDAFFVYSYLFNVKSIGFVQESCYLYNCFGTSSLANSYNPNKFKISKELYLCSKTLVSEKSNPNKNYNFPDRLERILINNALVASVQAARANDKNKIKEIYDDDIWNRIDFNKVNGNKSEKFFMFCKKHNLYSMYFLAVKFRAKKK